jgi:ankyrin repeat protein
MKQPKLPAQKSSGKTGGHHDHHSGEKQRTTVEERVAHLTHVHNNQTEQIFAVMYTTIHKAAFDGSKTSIELTVKYLAFAQMFVRLLLLLVLGIPAVLHFLESSESRKVNINSFDKNGQAPIHIACDCGHNNLIRFVLGRGADVNLKAASDDATPLMLACKEGNTETVRILIDGGARLFERNRAGHSAIHYAAQGDHIDCVRAIHERFMSKKKELLDAAAAAGELSINSPLLKKGGDPSRAEGKDKDDSLRETRIALTEEEKEKLDYLKNESELIDQRSNSEMTPLHLACHFNAFRVAKFLVERKADVNALDSLAETPLHKAARGGHRTIYRLLVTSGADENIRSRMRDTPRNLLYDDAGL